MYLREDPFDLPARCSAKVATREVVCQKDLPVDLRDFWSEYFSASLFEDITYGQWGLKLLDYESSNQLTRRENRERPSEALRGDRVFGKFIGDSQLLVIRCDAAKPDFGSILVSWPSSPREEWYHVGSSLAEFLVAYTASEGEKFWEPHHAPRDRS